MDSKTKAILAVVAAVIAIGGVLAGVAISRGLDAMPHDDAWGGDMPALRMSDDHPHARWMDGDGEWTGGHMQMGAMPGMRATDRGVMAMDEDAFLAMMIPHHEMAVQMAQDVLDRGSDAGVRAMARAVIADQRAEIDSMRGWYRAWFGGEPPWLPMSGAMAMMGMGMDHDAIRTAADPDLAFLEAMVPHHAGALLMADMVLAGEPRDELAGLARDIIAAQSREIAAMQQLREQLEKRAG